MGITRQLTKKRLMVLLRANRSDTDAFIAEGASSFFDAEGQKSGTMPRLPEAEEFGDENINTRRAPGDDPTLIQDAVDEVAFAIQYYKGALPIDHQDKLTQADLEGNGWVRRLQAKVRRQVKTNIEEDYGIIVLGNGSAGDDTLADVVVLPAGDEFNAAAPAKTFEEYLQDAVISTGGNTYGCCRDVWNAHLRNPNLAENSLNQHSMSDAELRSWFAARQITNIVISDAKYRDKSFILAGMSMVGNPDTIRRAVLRAERSWAYEDEGKEVEFLAVAEDLCFRVGHQGLIRVFQNTLA